MIFGYQNHQLSAWPLLYFLFMAYVWNLCDTLLRSEAKSTFLFFQILSRCWDTRVQSYPTSARNIFGVAKKRKVSAEECSYRSTEKANMFKTKWLIEKVGTSYLKQVPWSPQQTIPDHGLHHFIQLWKFLSRTYSRFLIHIPVCVSECVSLCFCLCVYVFVYVSEFVCDGEPC